MQGKMVASCLAVFLLIMSFIAYFLVQGGFSFSIEREMERSLAEEAAIAQSLWIQLEAASAGERGALMRALQAQYGEAVKLTLLHQGLPLDDSTLPTAYDGLLLGLEGRRTLLHITAREKILCISHQLTQELTLLYELNIASLYARRAELIGLLILLCVGGALLAAGVLWLWVRRVMSRAYRSGDALALGVFAIEDAMQRQAANQQRDAPRRSRLLAATSSEIEPSLSTPVHCPGSPSAFEGSGAPSRAPRPHNASKPYAPGPGAGRPLASTGDAVAFTIETIASIPFLRHAVSTMEAKHSIEGNLAIWRGDKRLLTLLLRTLLQQIIDQEGAGVSIRLCALIDGFTISFFEGGWGTAGRAAQARHKARNGLSSPLCQQVVLLHQGRMTIESNGPRLKTITVRWPAPEV